MVNASSAYGRERNGDRAVRAEAALWTVLSQDAPADDARGLARWLAEDDSHAEGFARVQTVWSDLGSVLGAGPADDEAGVRRADPIARRPAPWLALAASIVMACAIGVLLLMRPDSYSTDVGERRVVALADGSRVTLNTASQIAVNISNDRREIVLERGEALFDVMPDAGRPFVVRARDRQVEVLGTTFSVRRDRGRLDVVVLHGSVAVADAESARSLATLAAGDRYRERSGGSPVVDRPDLEAEVAWRNGELVLDRTPLGAAVSEMNRYSPTRIVVADDAVARLPISGVFRTGESASFARTIAMMYDLEVRRNAGRLVVARKAASPS